MSARDRSAAAIVAAPGSGAFDDLGALVAAIRSMVDDAGADAIPAAEVRHLYVLSVMAETAWRELDDAMQPGAKR